MNHIKYNLVSVILTGLLIIAAFFISAANAATHIGVASWYGPGFHGKLMANGQRFNQHGNHVAHKSLPFGTVLKITNLNNGKTVVGVVGDRGPFVANRSLDVSKGLASKLGMLGSGTAKVSYTIVQKGNGKTYHKVIKKTKAKKPKKYSKYSSKKQYKKYSKKYTKRK